MSNDHTPAVAPGPAPAKSLEEVWLRRMAEAEAEGTVSVGGLVCDIEAMSNSDMGPAPGPRGDVEAAFREWRESLGADSPIDSPANLIRLAAYKAGAEWAGPSKEMMAVLDAAKEFATLRNSETLTFADSWYRALTLEAKMQLVAYAVLAWERVEAGRECEREKGGSDE